MSVVNEVAAVLLVVAGLIAFYIECVIRYGWPGGVVMGFVGWVITQIAIQFTRIPFTIAVLLFVAAAWIGWPTIQQFLN